MHHHHLWMYFWISVSLKQEEGISSRAFWMGYPWSNSMKQMPADNF